MAKRYAAARIGTDTVPWNGEHTPRNEESEMKEFFIAGAVFFAFFALPVIYCKLTARKEKWKLSNGSAQLLALSARFWFRFTSSFSAIAFFSLAGYRGCASARWIKIAPWWFWMGFSPPRTWSAFTIHSRGYYVWIYCGCNFLDFPYICDSCHMYNGVSRTYQKCLNISDSLARWLSHVARQFAFCLSGVGKRNDLYSSAGDSQISR